MCVAKTAQRRRRQCRLDTRYSARAMKPPKRSQGLAKLAFQRANSVRKALHTD